MTLLATPPASRKRSRRTSSGAFLSRNDFRVLELVAPCPAIARQTVKEALLSNITFSATIEPSGFASVITPTRLLVWNALRPEQAPVALAFDNHEVDSESSRRVALIYTSPDQKALHSVLYAQRTGLFLKISINGKQQRTHLPLNRHEYVTACTLVSPLLCIVATSSHRLLKIRLDAERLQAESIHIERSGASLLGLVGSAPSPSTLPYRKLISHAPMRLYGITENAIEELVANDSGSWTLSWCSSSVLEDALAAVSGASKASIVDVVSAQNRIGILTSAPVGPLNQLQYCIALYEHQQQKPDIVPVYRAQLLDSLEAEPNESLRIELSDQDIALAFVYGRRSLSMFDFSSGVHDCVRFDEPMLLGGGRAHDHRGCFFVSAANGIICARLARGPTTVSLTYADEKAPAQEAGLSGAFNAFQQARIANCRNLVVSLGKADLNDEALKISVQILDSEHLTLLEKQSTHASFSEFLNSMPTSSEALWNRLNPDIRKNIRLHGDYVEMALSFEQIISSPSASFHEVLPAVRSDLDSARDALLPSSVRKQFFATISKFTQSFQKVVSALDGFDERRRLLLLVVLCRAVRVIFNFASENIHPDSWFFQPETRECIRRLLYHLYGAAADSLSSSECLQKGFAYSNYYYISCVLLSGYLSQFSALETVPACSTLRSSLDVEYSADRARLGRDLIDLAPDSESNIRQRYALAFEFGERFTACSVLAELCEKCQWPERSDAYARELGDAYALACCSIWYNNKQFERLLAHIGQPWLAHFVEDKPRLSWIVDMDQGNFSLTWTKLLELAKDDSIELQLRAFFCAMAKLVLLRVSDCTPGNVNEVNTQLTHLTAIKAQLADSSNPLSYDSCWFIIRSPGIRLYCKHNRNFVLPTIFLP